MSLFGIVMLMKLCNRLILFGDLVCSDILLLMFVAGMLSVAISEQ